MRLAIISIISLGLVGWMVVPFFTATAREEIRVVGSSTVFPFVAAVAEQFGRTTKYRTPIVEATGTGGGFKLFCSGIGEQFPDVSNASRPIKQSERDLCAENGISDIVELTLGYDGIVLGNAKQGKSYRLTKRELFLALVKRVPQDGELVENPYVTWRDISPRLPNEEIRVYGPPPTSGTRDAFVELVMDTGCKQFPLYKRRYPDKPGYKGVCHTLREDGHFIEAGENDNIIVQKLQASPESLGIFGYSFLEQNSALVKPAVINGVLPTFDAIADGRYKVARSLHVYIKKVHVKTVPGLGVFARALVSDSAASRTGYLSLKGLIPLPPEQLAKEQARVSQL